MFYCYNNANNNISNKKKYDPYKELVKSLVARIKSTDINLLISLNLYLKSSVLEEVEKLALSIYQTKNINYKSIEKDIKKLHTKFGTNNLLYLYVISCSQVLDDYLYNRVVPIEKRVKKVENIEEFREVCSLIATITLISLILTYDLLSYRIEGIAKTDTDIKISKSIKRENISLAKGLFNLPVFLGAEDSHKAYRTIGESLEHKSSIKEYFNTQSVVLYQNMLELSFYKEEHSKYFKVEYDLNVDELFNKKLFAMDSNIMKLRKVLPPQNGVLLKLIDDNDIESIYFNEKEDGDDRIVAGVVRYTDGSENDFAFLISKVISSNIFCKHPQKVFMSLLKFYEVDYPNFKNTLNKYGDPKFEVLAPYYWKYRKNGYETNKEREQRLSGKKIKREHTVKISSFVRRIKGEPSADAKALAEKLFIKLEPNHTVVKEHTRTYNKSNNTTTDLSKIMKMLKALEK